MEKEAGIFSFKNSMKRASNIPAEADKIRFNFIFFEISHSGIIFINYSKKKCLRNELFSHLFKLFLHKNFYKKEKK